MLKRKAALGPPIWIPDCGAFVKARLLVDQSILSSTPICELPNRRVIRTINADRRVEEWEIGKHDLYDYDASHECGSGHIHDMYRLNDAAIVNGLRLKYISESYFSLIYMIAVAVNPGRMCNISRLNDVQNFKALSQEQQQLHIFSITDEATAAIREGNQLIIMKGESGGGKTEVYRQLMHFQTICRSEFETTHDDNTIVIDPMDTTQRLKLQIMASAVIIEKFGNCSTSRNRNSSRFAKFVQLQYRDLSLTGANFKWFQLERSRVISQRFQEGNFHVFYLMVFGLGSDTLARLRLDQASTFTFVFTLIMFIYCCCDNDRLFLCLTLYRYLNPAFAATSESQYEAKELRKIRNMFATLAIPSDIVESRWLACVG